MLPVRYSHAILVRESKYRGPDGGRQRRGEDLSAIDPIEEAHRAAVGHWRVAGFDHY